MPLDEDDDLLTVTTINVVINLIENYYSEMERMSTCHYNTGLSQCLLLLRNSLHVTYSIERKNQYFFKTLKSVCENTLLVFDRFADQLKLSF